MENIYFNTLIKKDIVIEPKYLTTQIDDYILKVLKKKYEGKCLHEGYVKEDSIAIEKKSAGLLYGSHFTGEMTYTILFRAEVCNPVAGNVIKFEVQSKNQMCLRGVLGPMEIVIPKEMAIDNPNELKLINSYQIGDTIKAEVIKSRFFPDGKNIRVIAKVLSSENNNNKNKNNKTFISSEINIDDEEMPNTLLQNVNVEEASDEESVSSDEESTSEEDESEEESMGEDIELSDSDNEQFNDDIGNVKDVIMKNPNEENVSDEEEENYEEDVEDEETSDNEGGDDEY